MKKSFLSIALASTALLGACDHYSDRLAALDGTFGTSTAAAPAPTTYATTETSFNEIVPAAGGNLTAGLPPTAPILPVAASASTAAPQQPLNLALAQAYYDRALQEKNLMDHSAAHYYTTKAEAALKGETPEPAMPADFGIERSDSEEMMEARTKLMSALQTYKGTDKQAALVQAQVEFDGWLDQYAENKTGPALTCREGFIEALAQLEAPVSETRRYGVFFDPGQFVLSSGAQTIVDDAANFVRENPGKPYTISLIEKATGPYSAQRIEAIKTALASKGVPAGSIVTAVAPPQAPVASVQQAAQQLPTKDNVEIVVSFGGPASVVPSPVQTSR